MRIVLSVFKEIWFKNRTEKNGFHVMKIEIWRLYRVSGFNLQNVRKEIEFPL